MLSETETIIYHLLLLSLKSLTIIYNVDAKGLVVDSPIIIFIASAVDRERESSFING